MHKMEHKSVMLKSLRKSVLSVPEQLPVQVVGSRESLGQPHTQQVRGVGVRGMHTPTTTSTTISIDTPCKEVGVRGMHTPTTTSTTTSINTPCK